MAEHNPVRVIEAFVDQLDLREMGFEGVDPGATGRHAYHGPRNTNAEKKPGFPARPIPSIDTNSSGSAGIVAKLRSIDENMKQIRSAVSRLRGSTAAPLGKVEQRRSGAIGQRGVIW